MDRHGYAEVGVFLACCLAVGCIGGLLATGIRMGWEAWRGAYR